MDSVRISLMTTTSNNFSLNGRCNPFPTPPPFLISQNPQKDLDKKCLSEPCEMNRL